MKGLSLNTHPKPKQAKTVELVGGRTAGAGGRQEPLGAAKLKEVKGRQRTGGCKEVEARKSAGGLTAGCAWRLGAGPAVVAMELEKRK